MCKTTVKSNPSPCGNGEWGVQIQRCSGKTQVKTFPTKAAAEQDIRQHNHGQLLDPARVNVKANEFVY